MLFYFLLLIFHIFSAMIWVGGMIFYVIVVIPVIRNPELKDQKLRLLQLTALQFRNISYFVFLVFVISGIGLLYNKGYFESNGALLTTNIGYMFLAKIGLFTILFLSSLYHDFVTGPKTFIYLESDPIQYERYRKTSAFFGRFNLLVSVSIALLGILASRGFSLF